MRKYFRTKVPGLLFEKILRRDQLIGLVKIRAGGFHNTHLAQVRQIRSANQLGLVRFMKKALVYFAWILFLAVTRRAREQ